MDAAELLDKIFEEEPWPVSSLSKGGEKEDDIAEGTGKLSDKIEEALLQLWP